MINRDNYKLVMAYLDYRERVIQSSAHTMRNLWALLKHLLQWADSIPLQSAPQIRLTFPEYLLTARNDGKDKQLSPSQMEKILSAVQDFYHWARREHPARFRGINEIWINALQVRRSAGAQTRLKRRKFYPLDEILKIMEVADPEHTLRVKRDKAALAFLFLSGMRDGAFVTLPLGAVDLARRRISQLPELGVLTKNSKAAITSLFPIAPLLAIVEEWDSFVRSQSDDPHLAWYTRLRWDGTEIDITDLIEPGRSWTGRVNALREGLKEICRLAGVEYKSPHKIRHGHGVYGIKRAKTMAELKALSQNMMHENISTTDGIYGNLVEDDVASILATFTPD